MSEGNLLDALVDAFDESDNEEEINVRQSNVFTPAADKSMFYKSAVEDQSWLHENNGNNESDSNFERLDTTDTTPTNRQNEKKQLTLSELQAEMHESYAKLPGMGATPSDKLLSPGEIEKEMETLKKRIQQLEEEKMRHRQTTENRDQLVVAKPSSQKVRDSPVDFTQPRTLLGNKIGGEKSVVEGNSSDDEEMAITSNLNDRFSRKRKSDSILVDGTKARRSAMTTADDPATAALREKGKDIGSMSAHKEHRFCSLAAYDPYFGIRVQTPKISSLTFQNYVGIRQKVRISELTADTLVNWDDWVTMGVLVDKTPLKTSASGSQFSIWKLSDLIDCQRVVRLLLFGDSAKTLWKLNKGDVVALLNAGKMENKPDGFPAEKTNVVTLKVDNKQKIVELGISPDYGTCKGTRKQDNLHCTNFVNKSKLDYCDFHLLTASKKLAARRGEFQLASNVPPKKFNNPAKKVLSGAGLRTSRLPIKGGIAMGVETIRRPVEDAKNQPSKLNKLTSVAAKTIATCGGGVSTTTTDCVAKDSTHSQFQEALRTNTVGSRHVLSQLAKDGNAGLQPKASANIRLGKSAVTCKEFLVSQRIGQVGQRAVAKKNDVAKAKAVSLLRARGAAITTTKKSYPSQSNESAQASKEDAPPAKRPRLLGQISALSKEQLKKLAESKPHHDAQLNEEDAQRQDAYFKVMEAKEKVDQRATEVMSLKACKVVTCRKCKYTWHAQSTLCKQESHVVQWHSAEKRFFKCRTCGNRTVAYDKYPNKPCQCGSTTFTRVAMRQESKGPKMVGESLKIRGDEEPFVNC